MPADPGLVITIALPGEERPKNVRAKISGVQNVCATEILVRSALISGPTPGPLLSTETESAHQGAIWPCQEATADGSAGWLVSGKGPNWSTLPSQSTSTDIVPSATTLP